jgi:hypothetical protein
MADTLKTDEFWKTLHQEFEENVESAGLDDNGDLTLRMADQDPATPGGATPNPASPGEPSPQPATAADEKLAALEKRVTDMQAWGTKLATENANLRTNLARSEGRLEGSGQGEAQNPDGEVPAKFDVAAFNQDPAAYLDTFIEDRVVERLTELWEPLVPDFQHVKTQRETAEFLSTHADALTYWDKMVELNKTLPQSLSLEELYVAAKEIYPEGSGTTGEEDPIQQDSPDTPTPSQPADDANQAIKERIERLRTEAPTPAVDLDSLPAVTPDAGVGRNPTIDEAMALAAKAMAAPEGG